MCINIKLSLKVTTFFWDIMDDHDDNYAIKPNKLGKRINELNVSDDICIKQTNGYVKSQDNSTKQVKLVKESEENHRKLANELLESELSINNNSIEKSSKC